MRAKRTMTRVGTALVLCTALTACTATFRNHGYVPREDELSAIKIGVDTRESVAELVGTPTSAGVLKDSGYYYVQSRVRHFAWQRPQEIEREVVAISFNKSGKVTDIGRYGLQDGQVVPLSRRATRTGQDISFIRQLLSKLGTFSAGDFIN